MTTTTTSDRLAAYRTAEAAVLQGQRVQMDLDGAGTQLWQGADLAELRAGIKELERQLAAEAASAQGAPRIGGLGFAVARFNC